jgi:hypothetical protein
VILYVQGKKRRKTQLTSADTDEEEPEQENAAFDGNIADEIDRWSGDGDIGGDGASAKSSSKSKCKTKSTTKVSSATSSKSPPVQTVAGAMYALANRPVPVSLEVEKEMTKREREKTKQLKLQLKLAALQRAGNNGGAGELA